MQFTTVLASLAAMGAAIPSGSVEKRTNPVCGTQVTSCCNTGHDTLNIIPILTASQCSSILDMPTLNALTPTNDICQIGQTVACCTGHPDDTDDEEVACTAVSTS